MRISGLAVCGLSMMLAAGACNRSSDSATTEMEAAAPPVSDFNAPAAAPTGTSGGGDVAEPQQERTAERLPDGASPLALIGGLGLLSLLGAAATRVVRRNW